MDDYPRSYVAVTRPLIVLLGLQDEPANASLPKPLNNGTTVALDSPNTSEETLVAIAQSLKKYDSSHVDDPSTAASPLAQNLVFHFKPSSRRYVLPSRKASPPPSQVSVISGNGQSGPSPILHSPLSPLSPGSTISPDGIMTPLWFMKYQEALPSAFVSFIEIGHDVNNDTLKDNRMKNEIIAFQSALNEANYKGRHAVVLMGNDDVKDDPSIDARLNNIRKAAKLDNKSTFFYIPAGASMTDLDFFAETMLQALRPHCADYYKTLHKHARRKKDRRSSSLPSTPTLETAPKHLLHAGWNTRYAVKMGLFSEIRYEMDAASRSFGEALDCMLEPQGSFDQMSSWSPRFNEARTLADSIAIRRARCLLADGHTATAVTFWNAYHDRIKDLVERLGKGTETYGWPCWEARWAYIMAELIHSVSKLSSDSNSKRMLEPLHSKRRLAYAMADRRNRMQDLSNPWTSELHHPGYWYAMSAKYQGIRAALAREIPEEDKVPPDQSPASSVSRVHREYESYMCPEPNVEGKEINHSLLIAKILKLARQEYEIRDHANCAATAGLAVAEELAGHASAEALSLLLALRTYPSADTSKWKSIYGAIALRLYQVAKAQQDIDSQIVALWTLSSQAFEIQRSVAYDMPDLIGVAGKMHTGIEAPHILTIDHDHTLSFISANVCFEGGDVSAGDRARFQVILTNSGHPQSTAITFTEISIQFDGFSSVSIGHTEDVTENEKRITTVELSETANKDESVLQGDSDLKMQPGQTRVYIISLQMRDTGMVRAAKVSLSTGAELFKVQYIRRLDPEEPYRWYSLRPGYGLVKQRQRRDASSLEVLPKQPKMILKVPNLRQAYYTSERAQIDIEMKNGETEEVDAEIEVWLAGVPDGQGTLAFTSDEHAEGSESPTDERNLRRSIGSLAMNATSMTSIAINLPPHLDGEISLELEVRYAPTSDPLGRVSKTSSTKLNVIEPLAASFVLQPLLHSKPWPSYFDTDGPGISMRWRLQSLLESRAMETIVIKDARLQFGKVAEGATCNMVSSTAREVRLDQADRFDPIFDFDIQKQDLDDLRPATIEGAIEIDWHRADSGVDRIIRTIIPTPRLNLPTVEPRALATRGPPSEDGTLSLTVTLENPSMHYLSFETTLEPTDDVILSGPTKSGVNLVPLSRHAVDFSLMPAVHGSHVRLSLKVVDTYFNKRLQVHPGEGLSIDDAGNLLLWMDQGG